MVEQRPEKPCVAGSIPALSTSGERLAPQFIMYHTYILISQSTDKLYIGQTNNLEARLRRHNIDKNFSTKNRGPWKLIFSKVFETRGEAMKYEKYLKSLKNKEYILKNICNYATT